MFFFWIFSGSAENQGNSATSQVSSAYFNISNEELPGSPTTLLPETSTKTKTSTSSAATIEQTSSQAPDASTASTTVQGDMQTYVSPISSPTSSASDPTPSSSGSGQSGGISTGAGIGIGVGVGLAGLSAVVCAAIVVCARRTRLDHREKQSMHADVPELPPSYAPNDAQVHHHGMSSRYGCGVAVSKPLNCGNPAELSSSIKPPVELDAGLR